MCIIISGLYSIIRYWLYRKDTTPCTRLADMYITVMLLNCNEVINYNIRYVDVKCTYNKQK